MKMHLKVLVTGFILFFMIGCNKLYAQDAEKQVQDRVQALTKAMINADSMQLYLLTDKSLTYGHSSGVIQNQQEFVEGITSGKSDFVTINLSDQSIHIVGHTAVVRHTFEAKTNDNNVPGEVKLSILLVWVKENGNWKLVARQAVKPS